MCRLSVGARAACLRGFEAFEAFFGVLHPFQAFGAFSEFCIILRLSEPFWSFACFSGIGKLSSLNLILALIYTHSRQQCNFN